MKNKKLLISMFSMCFLASCTFGVACNFKKQEDSSSVESSSEGSMESEKPSELPEENLVEVALDKTELKLDEYDKAQLTATVYGSTAAVVWSSSNAAVVTVDNEGKLVAVGVGEATVSATVEGASASCKVVVAKSTTAPVIQLSSEDVYLNLNDSFTSSVKALWKGEELENVSYTWTVAEGNATDVATAVGNGNTVTFTALKEGTTVFRVATDIRGIHVSKDVAVTVYGNDVSIVAANSAFIPAAGYYALNLATANIEDYKNSTDLTFKVYENGKEVDGAEIAWTINDVDVATFDGENIVGASAGETEMIGTCTVNGVTANIIVHISVVKPVIALQETTKAVLEVENLSTLTIETPLLGTIESATIHDKEVFAGVSGQTLFFNKENMPKLAKELGEQTLYVSTDMVTYTLPVTIYSMIINNKEEMDQLVSISYANAGTVGVWDGYFVLGNDIDYNGEFIPMTSHNHLYGVLQTAGMDLSLRYNASACGFRGIFDGMGYNIDGLAIGVNKQAGNTAEAGIFGVIHQNGIVRNVSFTNAVVRENSGYIAASGGGLIENVSISYKQIGGISEVYCPSDETNTKPRIASSFFSTRQGVAETACVRNCFVDASNAKINWDMTAEKKRQWPALQLAGAVACMENVIVVCPNTMVAENSGANFKFADYASLSANEYVQSEFVLWDNTFWTNISGIPFSVNIAKNIDVDAEIRFNAPDIAFAGRDTQIGVVGQYTKVVLAEEYEGVSYANGVLTASDEAVGKTVTLVLTSYINDQVVEKDIAIKKLSNVTLNQTQSLLVESTDTMLDISVGAQFNGETATVYTGSAVVGKGAIVDGKIAVDASLLAAAGYGESTVQVMSEKDGVYNFYDLKVFYVTKILKTVEDFQYISVQGGDRVNNPTITGYYILGNDIDCAGAKISANRATEWNVDAVGFRGTFDGNGKTISNAKIAEGGLFGHVGKGAIIKNVTFDNTEYTLKKWQRTVLLGNFVKGATLQNITVNITSYGVALNDAGEPFVEQGLFAGRYFLSNIVENVTFNVAGFDVYRLISRVSNGNTYSNVKIYADSYQTIGDSDDNWTAITELPVGMEFISTKSDK